MKNTSLVEPIEPRRLFAAGLTASYFAATSFTGKSVTQTDAAVSFNWKKSGPAASISPVAFSARWTGALEPVSTGSHAVYVSTEGGVRVWVNDKLVLNKWAAPGVVANYKVRVTLTAGTAAPLLIEYRHDSGHGSIGVAWVEPGGTKQLITGSVVSTRAVALSDQIDHARSFAGDQLSNTYRTLSPANGVPTISQSPKTAWALAPVTDWTSGTFAGAMWAMNTTFGGWSAQATAWTTPLANVKQVGDAFDREWAAYQPLYDATGDANARKVLLASAALKMTAWNKTVRAFKTPDIVSTSANPKANYGVLMDQTMDMAELLWAGRQLGDTSYQDRVLAHMHTVAANMVRADGSVSQRGYFDSATGKYVVGENSQGYSNTSTWSRAQAWAINSFSTVAAATGDATCLATAKKVADYFIAHTPADGVPYWDFQSPAIPHTYRDSSAAAIAADGMIRLAGVSTGADKARYEAAAQKILTALTSNIYLAQGTAQKGLMLHGAANVPKDKGDDASLMFGDYYLLTAMNDYTSTFA